MSRTRLNLIAAGVSRLDFAPKPPFVAGTPGLITSLFVAFCSLLVPLISDSEELPAAKGREIFKKYQASVITVQLVVKSKMGFAGLGGDSRESKQEVSGTVIDPSGLTVVSLSSTDPTSLLQSFMGSFGGDGEES